MASISSFATDHIFFSAIFTIVSAYTFWTIQVAIANIYIHKLSKFPGPKSAAATTYYKTLIEGILGISWHSHLAELHAQYGPIVRVGPNELHFSDPQAYLDIYNNSNRWDKEEILYHSFGEDQSSFGFLTYKEAKERKDVLNKLFSARAILGAQDLVQSKIDDLCSVFTSLSQANQPVNLSHAFRCMTIDIITTYCFGTSIDAIRAPQFQAPIILAMDAAAPVFVWFKHSSIYKNMIQKCPRPLSRIISPPTVGLVDLQEILSDQVEKFTTRPEEALSQLSHRRTIYQALLDPANYRSPAQIPSPTSLYEEAQALMFAGADTVGFTLMNMAFHLSQPHNVHHLEALQSELKQAYPDPNLPPPPTSTLESLPILNATLKESLRLFSGVISGLPRIVPPSGATIASTQIPASTIVSIGSTFVHYNAKIFPSPQIFDPTRWLSKSSSDLETFLIPFSRGPRSCLGINLAWAELRLAGATVFRKFAFVLDAGAPTELRFRETFLPQYTETVYARVQQLDAST